MKASRVADHIDARTEKVYQPLKKLESMDYVVITDSGPKRYKAQNPTFVIRQEREQFQSETEAVLGDLQEGWERTQEGNQSTDDYAWVAAGTDGMKIETEKLISQATESIAGFDTRFHLTSPDGMDDLWKSIQEGVDIHLTINKSAKSQGNEVEDWGGEVYITDNITKPSFYIIDSQQVLLNVSSGRATIVFEDRHFADVMRERLEQIDKTEIDT